MMNYEVLKEERRKAVDKYRAHQEAYGIHGRYYNMKAMDYYQDLIDIYDSVQSAANAEKAERERSDRRATEFIKALKAYMNNYGRMNMMDLNEFLTDSGYRILFTGAMKEDE
jgi:hypothetical protein